MPFCSECRNWFPVYSDSNDKDFLDVAYHDFECGRRAMDDWAGNFDTFIFDGDVLYEVQPDGSRVAVSTYSNYPEAYEPPELPAVTPPTPTPAKVTRTGVPVREWAWEDWKTENPTYAKDVDLTQRSIQRQQAHQTSYTTWKPPWEGIDRARFPRAWWWAVKFHFLPSNFKETKYQGSGYMYSPYGEN